ncbi:MAG: hypothetical protein WC724_02855 [Candidatus Paceibacterota bacterium]|jgi:hypothetical protein
MGNRALLRNIPQEIQKRYNIGPEVEVVVSGESMGGNFSFQNLSGQHVGIDAVELCGTEITIQFL